MLLKFEENDDEGVLMDLLTHVFLPLIFLYSIDLKDNRVLMLSSLALFPDLDVFLGIHRGLFHSLFIIIPLIALVYFLAKSYYKLSAYFLTSHLFLDFLTGGVPFLYPLIETGVGVEFPLVVKFSSAPVIVEYLPRIVFSTPSSVVDKTFELFSSFGIASMLIFLAIYLKGELG